MSRMSAAREQGKAAAAREQGKAAAARERNAAAREGKAAPSPGVRGVEPYSADEVYDLLAARYGKPERRARLDGVSELVWTILSQHTSDLNAERAFAALSDRYPTWEAALSAPEADLVETIRGGGLARQKAPRIQQALRSVRDRAGGFDIGFLAHLPLEEAKAWLREIPGVGPKTAGVVLSFAMDQPAMAVDTHVHRVAKRLALIGPKVTADAAHDVLERAVAPERTLHLHIYLITHGRRVCKARRPLCAACPLAERCPEAPRLISEGDTRVPTASLSHKPL